MADVRELCGRLLVLRYALAAALDVAHKPDVATPHPTLATALVGTPRRDVNVGRSVPGSRPPTGPELDVSDALDRAVMKLAGQVRAHLRHVTVDPNPDDALTAIARFVDDIHPSSTLGRRIPRVLGYHMHAAMTVLGMGRRWITLGMCPVSRDPYPASWDEDDENLILGWWNDGVCRIYIATLPGPTVADRWRRSVLRVDGDADMHSRKGDIVCPGCRNRWEYREWLRLGRMLREERRKTA